ncbi:hypothetical protein [Flaviaesturariibacter amylovorans]|uniref:Beta-lactamase-inhibitor-like PepSY-like domain-containing protein n=1 Tax=Flaviaesturariibacter amylovorans TaxID=1084520 RepID=A0ABP8HMC0_9BACT
MKTILLALSLLAGTFFNNARATENEIDPTVTAAFESRFANATEVAWSDAGGLYKVRFTLDGQTANAFYNTDGALVALTRQLAPSELPAALRASLRPSLEKRWITDVFEVKNETGITYYATLENADSKVVLQSVRGRKWMTYNETVRL